MRVFTVLGPSHSGKTSLVDALGRLDGGFSGKFEVSGAVIFRAFSYLRDEWTAIDIAGGSDNLAFAGPTLAASDAAVLCVPPEADTAVLCAPYLRLIEEAKVPCFIFINHMDTNTERVRDIVSALQSYCRHNIVLRQVPIRTGGEITGSVDLISERAWEYREGKQAALIELPKDLAGREQDARTELLESLADFDDDLLEQLIEDQQPMTADVYTLAAQVLQHNDLVPAFVGAACHGNGVTRLMKSLRHEVPQYEVLRARLSQDKAVNAIGCLADTKKHVGKLVVVRALGPGVAMGEGLGGKSLGGITKLDAKTPIKIVQPGQIGLTVKSDHLQAGRLYTVEGDAPLPDWTQSRPAGYHQIISPTNERDDVRLSSALARLAEIDPGLKLEQDEVTGKAIVGVQGPLHLRHITERLTSDFAIKTENGLVPPAYRETISKSVEQRYRHRKQSGGAGQFADVIIEIRPQPRDSGFLFEEQVKGGAVPRNYIPSVKAGALETLVEGPNGYPVVDICVILKDGKHHAVDSSDYAFRMAGRAAVREALSAAGPFVLQPVVQVKIHVPSIYAGGLVSIVSGMKGQVLGFEGHPTAAGWDVFSALMPAAAQDELFRALGGATRGTAWFTAEFDHYEDAKNSGGGSGKS